MIFTAVFKSHFLEEKRYVPETIPALSDHWLWWKETLTALSCFRYKSCQLSYHFISPEWILWVVRTGTLFYITIWFYYYCFIYVYIYIYFLFFFFNWEEGSGDQGGEERGKKRLGGGPGWGYQCVAQPSQAAFLLWGCLWAFHTSNLG